MSWNIDKYIPPTVYIFSELKREKTLGELFYFTEEYSVSLEGGSECGEQYLLCINERFKWPEKRVFLSTSGDMIFVRITKEWICFARSFPLFQWWLSLPQLTPECRRTSSLSWRFSGLKCKLLKVVHFEPWGSGSQFATHYNNLWSFENPSAQVVPDAN